METEAHPTFIEMKPTFNIKHKQSKDGYSYNHKKGIFLKHNTKELIVLCMGSAWDNDYFKGVIIFCGGDHEFEDSTKKTNKAVVIANDFYIESDKFYCESGDVFDTFPCDEFTLFEGELNIKQYDD